MHLTAKFHPPTFNRSEVIVLTNRQIDKQANKQTHAAENIHLAQLCYAGGWVIIGTNEERRQQSREVILSTKRTHLHRVSKNVPPLACYNFDAHEWILIFFGRNVTDKVGNQKTLYNATSNNLCFCTTWQYAETR